MEESVEWNQCSKYFNCAERLQQHSAINSGETPFECDQCGMGLKVVGRLRIHKRMHMPLENFLMEINSQKHF